MIEFKDDLVGDKDPPFFREKFKISPILPATPPPTKKILLKTSLTLISKKVGESEQFSGAEHRPKGPFCFLDHKLQISPLSKTGSSLLSLSLCFF